METGVTCSADLTPGSIKRGRGNTSQVPIVSRNLDVLRAFAVMCVLVSHIVFVLTGVEVSESLGRVGVLLFFVHTCLVLLMSLERMHLEKGMVRRFYFRRAFRIYPLSVFMVLLMLVGRIPAQPHLQFEWPTIKTVASAVLLIENITKTPEVLGPMWSLPWEVQMYVVLPFLYLLLKRVPSMGLLMGIWMATVLARFGRLYLHWHALSLLWFAPCFLCGAIVWVRRHETGRVRGRWFPVFAVVLIVIGYLGLAGADEPWKSIVEYSVCLILGIALPFFEDMRASRMTRVAEIVARYSYSLYLAHMPILWFAFVRLANQAAGVRWCVFLALIVAVPVALYHWIEEPMIRVGKMVTGGQKSAGAISFGEWQTIKNPG